MSTGQSLLSRIERKAQTHMYIRHGIVAYVRVAVHDAVREWSDECRVCAKFVKNLEENP